MDNIPQKTKVIVTFLTNIQDSEKVVIHSSSNQISSSNQVLSNEEIDKILECYRQENKPRLLGLSKGLFKVPDNFNKPLRHEILNLFKA
ncbi:hypothetical protein [Geminocystis sp. GBBB08]|uniref:hypothetical protein n=1 Tax=Geminocystis sp. GBBB08 TaxID=2604140 RepID=UPI0027E32263|nr:hypothetical protein [Geminocystis sp. GBBB08]MBL1208242.1 hypothetical protein [Geminocystis sp. GBBB08]